jgi:magnesium transporter
VYLKNGIENNERSDGKDCVLEITEYNEEEVRTYEVSTHEGFDGEALRNLPEGMIRWINLDGHCSDQTVEHLGEIFNIHPLVVEDIQNSGQRAKVEDYGDYLYIVAKMIYFREMELVIEHVSFVLHSQYVISFGEVHGDVFEKIRERIQNKGTQVRKSGADYLMYSLLDAIVDGYFDVLEVLGEWIDDVEESVMVTSDKQDIHRIREIKKYLLYIHKYIWPLREVTSWLGKDSSEIVTPATEFYIKDVYDHIIQIIDTTETYRELLAGLMDLHLSNVSYRMNEVMKVLTIISTIFIPLTFIAGVYGMNFVYMPELRSRWGYPLTWLVMVAIAAGMIRFFKKKKWF